jgi:hypothetical protein
MRRRLWTTTQSTGTRRLAKRPATAASSRRRCFRSDAVDPFARAATDPDFDGSVRGVMKGLPPLPIPLTRVLNGGNDVEIYQLAKPGENIRVKSKYLDIYQKEGRTGTMVFLLTETIYTNQKGELLLKAVQTRIMR